MFLTLIIPGPKNPGQNIDLYLQPLIDELKELWENGVETYDAFKKQNFQMPVALMWTINDFLLMECCLGGVRMVFYLALYVWSGVKPFT